MMKRVLISCTGIMVLGMMCFGGYQLIKYLYTDHLPWYIRTFIIICGIIIVLFAFMFTTMISLIKIIKDSDCVEQVFRVN